jgi:hypothetical protein
MTNSIKYIGMDVHKESISIAVRNAVGKVVMESVIETKASMVLQFIDGLRGDLQVTVAYLLVFLLCFPLWQHSPHFFFGRR